MVGVGSFQISMAFITIGGIIVCVFSNYLQTKQVREWHHDVLLKSTGSTLTAIRSNNDTTTTYHPMNLSDHNSSTILQQDTDNSQQQQHCEVPKNCSCEMYDYDNTNQTMMKQKIPPKECCTRHVLTTHKMGFVLSRSMPIQYDNNDNKEAEFLTIEGNFDVYKRPIEQAMKRWKKNNVSVDFREVFVLRDVYSALVSGYLYHRTGRECHLDEMGVPYPGSRSGWLSKHEWTQDFIAEDKETKNSSSWMKLLMDNHPPAGKKQTLCEYLAKVPEKFGQTVYTMFAFRNHLRPLYKILQLRKRINDNNSDCGRVLYVCQRDFADPNRYINTTHSVLTHLKLKNRNISLPSELFATNINDNDSSTKQQQHKKKKNGHMTEQNKDLRKRLKGFVEEIDHEMFDSNLEKMRALVGCQDDGNEVKF